MNKVNLKFILILVFSSIGLLISLYSTWDHVMIQNTLIHNSLFCNFFSINKCITVSSSKYALIGPIPVAWFGFLYYWWIITSVRFKNKTKNPDFDLFLFLTTSVALIFSIYLSIVLLALKTLCIFCICIALINVLVFVLTFLNPRVLINRIKTGHGVSSLSSSFFSFILLLIIGLVLFLLVSKYYFRNSQDIPVETFQNDSTGKSDIAQEYVAFGEPVRIMAIIDYSCPYCKYLALNLPGLLIDYKDKVELVYVNDLLNSSLAARAAITAKEYNEFNYFHYQMFLHQDVLDSTFIIGLMQKKHIDINDFVGKLNSENTIKKLNSDILLSQKAGCTGLPALFINGKNIDPWNNSRYIKHNIEKELN